MDRETRRKAMEAKRARLQQLRNEAAAAAANESSSGSLASYRKSNDLDLNTSRNKNEEGLDALVSSLLNKPVADSSPTLTNNGFDNSESLPSSKDISRVGSSTDLNNGRPMLSVVSDFATVSIAYKQLTTYDKSIQTDADERDFENGPMDSDEVHSKQMNLTVTGKQQVSSIAQTQPNETLEQTTKPEKSITQENGIHNDIEFKRVSDEERILFENDEEYISFLSQNTRVVERVMKHNFASPDLYIDYGKRTENKNIGTTSRAEKVKLIWTASSDQWTKDRVVTDIRWSPHHRELFLTAHNKRRQATNFVDGLVNTGNNSNAPNGIVCVWSTFMVQERPEYIFTCQSDVETAIFHPFSSRQIIGATYSGQIIIWDLCANSAPIQRSQLFSHAHTEPVFSIAVTGTLNAHRLVSISTDGKLCLWDLSNISSPTECHMLKYEEKFMFATAMALPAGEVRPKKNCCMFISNLALINRLLIYVLEPKMVEYSA